jgi:hypothetical protein
VTEIAASGGILPDYTLYQLLFGCFTNLRLTYIQNLGVNRMKLSYRGIGYEKEQTPVMMQEGEIGGKYRGQAWKYRYPRHVAPFQPTINKKYRGISYDYPVSTADSAASLTGKFCTLPAKQAGKVTVSGMSEAHLENIRRSLERRLQAAQAKGDTNLVQLLKHESQELTLNL